MDGAFGGGAHGIEAKERAGWHQDARAGHFRPLHQIPVFQKLADRERHEDFARFDHRDRHLAKHVRRQAFDDDVARLRQSLGGDDRNAGAGLGQIAPRLVRIAHGDGCENEPRNAGFEPAGDPKAHGAEPGQSNLKCLPRRHPTFHWQRFVRPDTLSKRLPACGQYGRLTPGPLFMPDLSKRLFMTNINPNAFTTRPEIEGTFGVVTTTHWIATAVGMGILERGGNAFDAAVATAFTLQVVEPHLNGPGGDVPVILYDVRRGKPEVICGQGVAPAKAPLSRIIAAKGSTSFPAPGFSPRWCPAHSRPGCCLLRDYGTMPLGEVLAPAIGYAQNGYPLLERASATIATVAALFREHWPTSAAVYLPNNQVPPTGSLFTNKTFAATYGRIIKDAESSGGDRVAQIERARKSWSHGFVAEAIDRFCRTQEIMDTSGKRHRGVLTADDMARWTPHIEAPLTYDYKGYTVCKTGPWGQGPVTLQQLALLKGFDLDGADPTGPDFIHSIVECSKLAYADREVFYGDPDFVEVPMATLLSDAYNSERRKLVTDKASLEQRPGSIAGFGAVVKLRREAGPAAAGRR